MWKCVDSFLCFFYQISIFTVQMQFFNAAIHLPLQFVNSIIHVELFRFSLRRHLFQSKLNVWKELMKSFSPVEVVDVVERWWLGEAHPSLPDALTAVNGLDVLSSVLEKNGSITGLLFHCGTMSAVEMRVSSQMSQSQERLCCWNSRRPKQTFDEQQQLHLFQKIMTHRLQTMQTLFANHFN